MECATLQRRSKGLNNNLIHKSIEMKMSKQQQKNIRLGFNICNLLFIYKFKNLLKILTIFF